MAFVVKVLKTIRNNWKKSVFAVCAGAYGIKFAVKKHKQELFRRELCAEALEYGKQKISINDRPRKVIVLLNPAASTGKASKLFEKNAAPILYLSGLEVNVVKTEYEGQAKDFLSVLERNDADGVVAAGGDGLLLEVVTGMMRKNDQSFRHKVPVGVIPLGKRNNFAKILFGEDEDEVRAIAKAAMSVVKGQGRRIDVLKVETDNGKDVYALRGLEAGAYRDADNKKSKYWYFGPFKHRWAYFRTTMKEWPPALKGKISYILATEENTQLKQVTKPEVPAASEWRWFHIFYKPKPKVPKQEETDEEEVDLDMSQEMTRELSTTELSMMSTSLQHPSQQGLKSVEVGIGPSEPTKKDFISEGLRRSKHPSKRLGTDANESMFVKNIKFVPEVGQDQELWYSIDGENFEGRPVDISLLRNRLRFFCYDPHFKIT